MDPDENDDQPVQDPTPPEEEPAMEERRLMPPPLLSLGRVPRNQR